MHECDKKPKDDAQFINFYHDSKLGDNVYYCDYCGERLDVTKETAIKYGHPKRRKFSDEIPE